MVPFLQAATRKKAILDFCGFAFAADHEEKELEARRVSLGKWKLELIHRLMDTLDLPRGSGDKGAKIDRVMEFLATPSAQSDVDLAAKEAAKKEKAKRKREREAAKKEKLAAMKAKEAAKKRKAGAAKGTPSKVRIAGYWTAPGMSPCRGGVERRIQSMCLLCLGHHLIMLICCAEIEEGGG